MQQLSKLSTLKIGDSARISFSDDHEAPTKLYDLGLVEGVAVRIRNIAPFGGPICLELIESGHLIALRKSEAQHILAIRI